MKKLAFGALLVGLLVACGGDDGDNGKIQLPDAGSDTPMVCNPLTQAGCAAGEKCTWLLDALMPQYVGHVGCAVDGTAQIGDACMYGAPGATGFDNCVKGSVCGNYRGGAGVCKQICDQQGGTPPCDASHVCVTYSRLFSTDATQPAAAGVCDLRCDPLTDNDFDGSQGTLDSPSNTKRTMVCGTDPNVGCYGSPRDTPPGTGWSCTGDINAAEPQPGLRHRVQCIDSNNCADGDTIYINSCNQGYLPLLIESSFVSTAVCVALCKPATCYNGNCGGQNVNRQGVAGDACNDTDRATAAGKDFSQYNTGGANDPDGGEHCAHSWIFEVGDQGLLKSPTSDTVGFCYNHELYKWDSDNDGMIKETDQSYPNCARLGSGTGSANYTGSDATIAFGAVDFGCVPTDFIPMAANGKVAPEVIESLRRVDLPRVLYRRTMGTR